MAFCFWKNKAAIGSWVLQKQFFHDSLFILAVFGGQFLVFGRKSAFVLYSDTAEHYTADCPCRPVCTLVNPNKKSAGMDIIHSDAHSSVVICNEKTKVIFTSSPCYSSFNYWICSFHLLNGFESYKNIFTSHTKKE